MDKDEFLSQFSNDTNQYSLLDIVYGEFVEYCRKNNLDEDDITTDELKGFAEDVIQNGL